MYEVRVMSALRTSTARVGLSSFQKTNVPYASFALAVRGYASHLEAIICPKKSASDWTGWATQLLLNRIQLRRLWV